MKKLEKLNAKTVESLASVKGGLRSLTADLSFDDQEKTTYHCPCWDGRHYVCDSCPDPKK